MWPLTVAAVLAKALARSQTRLVLTEHTTWSRSDLVRSAGSRFVARATMNLAFRSADAIVCVSRGAADDLARFARIQRSNVHAIYNPIVNNAQLLPTAVIPRDPHSWWDGPHKRILAVGTLIPLKGFRSLMRSFAEVRAAVDARLLILGEGPARQELESEIRRLQLEGDVFLPGSVQDPTPYYARADLSVMASEVEGFGNVLVEALACGTPVVSTDCPSGPREILGNGEFGKLVPVGDSSALAEAILQTLRSPLPADVLRSRAALFSIASAGKQYQALLFPHSQLMASESAPESVHT
jgi:glycosyltransferase involved in cell wall biosynthesis